MKRYNTSKLYDVKSFLYKNKSKKKFVSLTLTKDSVKKAVGVLAVMAITPVLAILWGKGSIGSFVIEAGIKSVLPFFENSKVADADAVGLFLYSGVSPLFEIKEKESEPPKENIDYPKPDIKSTSNVSDGIDIKNETEYTVDTLEILGEEIRLKTSNPKVLIVHTHGSESYTPSSKYSYKQNGNYRTQDNAFNVIRVGEELASRLKKKGIEVIHDKTINDYPSYNDSYNKTEKIIKNHLSKDKDIAFVFDIHRDAVGEGNSIVKFLSEVNGKKTAQVMIVCGSDTNLENPNWRQNMALAVHIQNKFENDYPGFLRPLNLRKERFNMHLTTGSLLFEVGTNGNTMDEAITAAGILGDGLGDFLSTLQ